jgi:hypothetical protein
MFYQYDVDRKSIYHHYMNIQLFDCYTDLIPMNDIWMQMAVAYYSDTDKLFFEIV